MGLGVSLGEANVRLRLAIGSPPGHGQHRDRDVHAQNAACWPDISGKGETRLATAAPYVDHAFPQAGSERVHRQHA